MRRALSAWLAGGAAVLLCGAGHASAPVVRAAGMPTTPEQLAARALPPAANVAPAGAPAADGLRRPFAVGGFRSAYFGMDEQQVRAAIVGLKEDNLFVDAGGAWKAGAYVPAYVRRYPFIFADDKDRGLLSLCVDEPSLVADGGTALFEGDGPSAFTTRALDFCKQYHAAALPTLEFARAVVEQDLLADRQVNAKLKDGAAYVLNGMKMIDEDKVAKLSGKVLAEWNAKGWLKGLFTIIQSSANWPDLGDMLAAVAAPAAVPKRAKSKV